MQFNIMQDFFDPGPIWQWLFNFGAPRWWEARSPIIVNPIREDINIRWITYNGQKKHVYNLVPEESGKGNPRAGRLSLWYLPYFQDQTHYTILDPDKSTIMVTAPMSGCTFGAGTATIKGEMIVTHANNASAANLGAQRSMQAKAAKATIRHEGVTIRHRGLGPKLLEPKHYRTDSETEILLFGVYADGKSGKFWTGGGKKWRFYQHVYTRASDDGHYKQLKVADRIFRIR